MQYVKMFIQVILIITPVFICQFPQNSNLQIKFPKCLTNNDCGHGTCDPGSGVCKCDDGYVTHFDITSIKKDKLVQLSSSSDEGQNVDINLTIDEIKMCNYQLRKQLTALMISIFVGFGSEHFYMGNYDVAAGKLVFYIFCYYLNIAIVIIYVFCKKKRNMLKFIGIFEGIYLGMGFGFMFCWNLRDWIKIGLNDLPDGKGYKLYSWNDDEKY